jgi:hypothetical protein
MTEAVDMLIILLNTISRSVQALRPNAILERKL